MINCFGKYSLFRRSNSIQYLRKSCISSTAAGTFSSLHKQSPTVDTIYALSSGPNVKSGVAVVRISGPLALHCLEQLKNPNKAFFNSPKPREASLRTLYCPKSKEIIDKGIVLWFPKPHSFTGEDVVELHLHGSRAVISGLFDAFEYLGDKSSKEEELLITPVKYAALRPAEKGEFTKRAFENGKMDLTEVEGLADLLSAETALQRKQAILQISGHLKVKYESWRSRLLKCLAHTEAVIDFGDDDREGDIDDHAMAPLMPIVETLVKELEHHVHDGKKGEIIREGIQIALVGQPNAGKSSLMNALARRPAAIVSPIAGTTRDIVEVRLDINGVACIVRDTAGLRINASDAIEEEGIRRARQALQDAHVRVFVVDSTDINSFKDAAKLFQEYLTQQDIDADTDCRTASRSILVFNKVDLQSSSSMTKERLQHRWAEELRTQYGGTTLPHAMFNSTYSISCTTGEGLNDLESGIAGELKTFFDELGQGIENDSSTQVFITRERHRTHVKNCIEHLHRFLSGRLPMDIAAEEIRLAMSELGKITGIVDTEEMLDIIFRDFCIGK